MASNLAVVILTHNEAVNLKECLASLSWCEDIHVVDSGSTDETCSIAERLGTSLYHHPFESFGKQRNWSLANCHFKNDWVLFLDADERAESDFVTELLSKIRDAPDEVAGFYCCWKTLLGGSWLKRSDGFPRWQFRVLRRGKAEFEDFGHSQRERVIEGTIDYIKNPYTHLPFNKGWEDWWAKHNRYSSQEAKARLSYDAKLSELFDRHFSKRMKTLKTIVSRIPGWPLLYFLVRYVLQFGFLDGRGGLIFCTNMAYYEFMIQLKMRELKRDQLLLRKEEE